MVFYSGSRNSPAGAQPLAAAKQSPADGRQCWTVDYVQLLFAGTGSTLTHRLLQPCISSTRRGFAMCHWRTPLSATIGGALSVCRAVPCHATTALGWHGGAGVARAGVQRHLRTDFCLQHGGVWQSPAPSKRTVGRGVRLGYAHGASPDVTCPPGRSRSSFVGNSLGGTSSARTPAWSSNSNARALVVKRLEGFKILTPPASIRPGPTYSYTRPSSLAPGLQPPTAVRNPQGDALQTANERPAPRNLY